MRGSEQEGAVSADDGEDALGAEAASATARLGVRTEHERQ